MYEIGLAPDSNVAQFVAGLSRRQRELVLRSTRRVSVPAGAPLMEQERRAPHCALIIQGVARVIRNGIELGSLGEGDFFCLTGSATLVAETACVLLIAADEAFKHLMQAVPSFGGVVAEARGTLRTAGSSCVI